MQSDDTSRLVDLENEVKYADKVLGGNPAVHLCDRIRKLKERLVEAETPTDKKERMMAVTKDQISDLRSFQERVVVCTTDYERSQAALKVAKSQLESFLWRLEHDEK